MSALPEECWECVFNCLNHEQHRHYLYYVSLVSKQFLSITNRLRFPLTIWDESLPFVPCLLRRFPNVTFLDLTYFRGDLDALLLQISQFPLRRLTSLKFSRQHTFPANGMRAFAEKVKTLSSLTCSWIRPAIQGPNMMSFVTTSFIDSLLSLKSLTCLDFRHSCISDELLYSVAKEGLPLRKLVLKQCRNYTYAGISCLLSRCKNIQHLNLDGAKFLNDQLVAELSLFLGNLISIVISWCSEPTDSALFALVRNCPLLSGIKMKATAIGRTQVEDSNSLPQVKSLHLALNSELGDESIKMLSSICPNLEMLDLSYCNRVSEASVVEVLRTCCKIRHLNIASCKGVKKLFHGINFKVPNLEVLSLADNLGIDDETLSVVSKSFCGLLHLNLEKCLKITDMGVRQVVENCKQLREIDLRGCSNVDASVVAWMVVSRPSLRKIVAPKHNCLTATQKKLFLRCHGCRVW